MIERRHRTPGTRQSGLWPVLGALVVLLAGAPVGLALSRDGSRPVASTGASLGELAGQAGCRLTEYDFAIRSATRR